MKHTLRLDPVAGAVTFHGWHELAPFPRGGKMLGEEPFGPFRVSLVAVMSLEDWEASGRPVDLEVEL